MKRLFALALMCLFATTTVFAEEPADDDSGIDNPHVYHLKGDIDLTSTDKVEYDKPKIVAKIVYPVLSSEESPEDIQAFNEAVDRIVKEEISLFKKNVADAQSYQATLAKSQIHNNLNIDFDSATLNLTQDPIISIRFIIDGSITGQAHPYRQHRVLTMSLADDNELTLADLFKPDSNYLFWLSDYATKVLEKKLGQQTVFTDGLTPTEAHFSLWNLEPAGLRLTFDAGIVAPAVQGTQTIVVPYAALEPMIDTDSALGECIAHRKRCLQNNLMTGGFIDQAINTKHRGLNPVLS